MPDKLKRLISQAAAAGGKVFDPRRVRRQQQTLLYGGGAAITLFIAICAALFVRFELHDYFARVRSEFQARKAVLHAELQVSGAMMNRYAGNVELIWKRGDAATPAELDAFSNDHGKLVFNDITGKATFVAFAGITPAHPAGSYSRYLAGVLRQATSTALPQPPAGTRGLTGYVIGQNGEFLGVMGHWLAQRALALPPGFDLAALLRQLTPSRDATPLQRPSAGADGNMLLDTRVDPLIGGPVMRFARQLDDETGKPVGWLIFNARTRFDDLLASHGADDDYALVDPRANVLLGMQRDHAMIARALDYARAPRGDYTGVHRIGGAFVIGDRLPESDLVLMKTFTWRSVLAALIARVSIMSGAALLLIAMLWFAIVAFDRRALRPANRRAIRLIESEALNRALIRTAPAGLVLLSLADGDAIVRNETMVAYDRLTPHASLGKRLWQAYRESCRGDAPPGVATFELPLDPRAPESIYLAANIVRSKYRGIDVLLCTLLDITARKLTERKQQEAREAAEDANRAKSTFLATMSHEIRTPLNAIVGNLELMERAPLAPPERRRLKTIVSSSDALLRIINDVLDLSKAESNQMTLEQVPFDPRAVLRDVTAIFRPLAEAKHLALACRVSPELADGYVGDPTRLRQLVSNLVGNAIKFTQRGSVTIDAQVSHDAAGVRHVAIRVADTGIGIPADSIPGLFDVYIQADPSIYRRFGGSGLGLPLCKRIATLMQGTLAVESREGEGSVFVATLPLQEAAPGWRAALPEPYVEPDAAGPEGAVEADEARPIRVLVAEDHPASRALLRDQLDALRYDATIVTNGVEAMRAYFEQSFDVVLTDLGMPELDGYALANFLREQGARVPVIAMTAHATAEDYRRCEQVGVAEVVLKPLSIAALDAVLRRVGMGEAAARSRRIDADPPQPAMTDEMRQTLRAATLRSLDVIGRALVAGDIEPIAIELHSMRGGFALAGDAAARDACTEVEHAANAGGIEAFRVLWPDFESRIGQALNRLAEHRP
ncbi:ATP-binding protein [Burkholderia anthina]|uniref:ATP-binding protein n=1 Tax=Burkholderia anthina TaxID=179879 RepID=UPI00158D8383|nr:ATP-binding protein [Burkholderia anthina]